MKTKLLVMLTVFMLVLPGVLADIMVRLGDPYTNEKDLSKIEFTAHSDYYDICTLDETIIPVLITNRNKFSDTFRFEVDKAYASLTAKSAVLTSGKSVILPLKISPPLDYAGNDTLVLGITTVREGLKRSVMIKTNIDNCYLFSLDIDEGSDEVCGCEEEIYKVLLENNGQSPDSFTVDLDIPEWINSSLKNKTVMLGSRRQEEIILTANPICEEKGSFLVRAKAVSEKSEVGVEDEFEINVLPQDECYNTIISADNVAIDYFGKNIPVTVKNKGARDGLYSLSVDGIKWYSLSQTEFSLKPNTEKTINLALNPGEDVVEGDYNIDITAKMGESLFTESIVVKLKADNQLFEKTRYYLNYFRYYIWAGIIILILMLFLLVKIKKTRNRVKPKVIAEESKQQNKEVNERKESLSRISGLLTLILYLIFLALLALLTFSTFRYKAHYERVLGLLSDSFADHIVPYLFVFKYVFIGGLILAVIFLIIDFLRKMPEIKPEKQKKKELTKHPQKIREEKKSIVSKIPEERQMRFLDYIYLFFVLSLFLAIVIYAFYRLFRTVFAFQSLISFIKTYYAYFLTGLALVVFFILIINHFSARSNRKSRSKRGGKIYTKSKALKWTLNKAKDVFRYLAVPIISLFLLGLIIYLFIHYGLFNHITGFFIVYYPYILMGVGISVILILILHFHSKKMQ